MKSSTPDGRMCFRCKQPKHLKKESPEQPYCSRCCTRGHIPVKCPTKNQGNQQQDETCKNCNQQMDERRENWKRAQDQPQFSNPNNRCLHCADDHGSCDCPMRHQHQAPPTNNPVGSTGINSQYSPCFSQPSLPQHSQQSHSTARSSTPMLMINNPQQFQPGHQRHTSIHLTYLPSFTLLQSTFLFGMTQFLKNSLPDLLTASVSGETTSSSVGCFSTMWAFGSSIRELRARLI